MVREDTGAATAGWDDNDVAADTVHHYRVGARNSAGIGTPSAEAMGRSRPQLRLGGRRPYPLTAHASPWADAPVTATFAAYLPGRAYDLAARVPDPNGWWRVLLFGQRTTDPFWLPAAAGTSLGTTTALPQPPAAPQNLAATLARGRVTLTCASGRDDESSESWWQWSVVKLGTFTTLCAVYRYTCQQMIAYPCRRVASAQLWNSPCAFIPLRSVRRFRSCQPLAPDWPHPCGNPNQLLDGPGRPRPVPQPWRQIPASPAQKRRPGSTRPPSTWLASTDSRPVGAKPAADPLNPYRATRSCGPVPRRCAEAPR